HLHLHLHLYLHLQNIRTRRPKISTQQRLPKSFASRMAGRARASSGRSGKRLTFKRSKCPRLRWRKWVNGWSSHISTGARQKVTLPAARKSSLNRRCTEPQPAIQETPE